jgi:hypothetical protein
MTMDENAKPGFLASKTPIKGLSLRELLYLSDAKLTQFVMQKRKGLANRVKLEGEVKIPGIGGLKAAAPDKSSSGAVDLDTVVAELEVSSRSAGWYTNPDATVGQWVEFELPLNQAVLPAADGSVVIFVDEAVSESVNSPRLLLHGSPEHLRGVVSEANMARVISSYGMAYGSRFEYTLVALAELFSTLDDAGFPSQANASPGQRRHSFGVGHAIRDFNRGEGDFMWGLLETLEDVAFVRNAATWMSGWARITCILKGRDASANRRLITATPLYVQYAVPFDSEQ